MFGISISSMDSTYMLVRKMLNLWVREWVSEWVSDYLQIRNGG